MANPLSAVTSAYQSVQAPEQQRQVRNAKPAPKLHTVPQDTVSISQSGAAASKAQSAAKSAEAPGESESRSQ